MRARQALGSVGSGLGGCLLAALALLLVHCTDPEEDSGIQARVFQTAFSSTTAEIREFLAKGQGGAGARLTYVDRTRKDGVLCFLDFTEKSQYPAVHAIPAAKDAKVPVISPDGEWIVYAVGNGAEAGSPVGMRSSVYLVRMKEDAQPLLVAADSACEPRFVQNAAGKLEIIYTTLAPDLAWEGIGKTMKVHVDISGPAPLIGAAQVLYADGSYTGGLSWDGRFLCGGGGHVAMLELGGAKKRPDTLSLGLIQSCNASISSSREFTNTMMYLNTSGVHPSLNGGKPWAEWQAILISNQAGKLVKGFMHPKTFGFPLETEPPSLSVSKWHHSEWSNHPYFAAATLNADRYFKTGDVYSNTGFQERVYLINLRDSAYLEVLRPDGLKYTGERSGGFYWPWLWVEVPEGFQESGDWLKPPA